MSLLVFRIEEVDDLFFNQQQHYRLYVYLPEPG